MQVDVPFGFEYYYFCRLFFFSLFYYFLGLYYLFIFLSLHQSCRLMLLEIFLHFLLGICLTIENIFVVLASSCQFFAEYIKYKKRLLEERLLINILNIVLKCWKWKKWKKFLRVFLRSVFHYCQSPLCPPFAWKIKKYF